MGYSRLWGGHILLWLFALCGLSLPSVVAAEVVNRFVAHYSIESNGDLLVTEDISYVFSGPPRRGIIRTLDTISIQPSSVWYKKPHLKYTVLSVRRGGVPEPYEVQHGRENTEVIIGTEERRHSGLQRYQITYRVQGALTKGQAGLELYWNTTGNEWNIPIGEAIVTLEAPAGGLLSPRACYRGVVGSMVPCEVTTRSAQTVVFNAELLRPGEGVTIAQALNPDVISYTPSEVFRIELLGVPFLLGLLMVWAWRVYKTLVLHRPKRAIIPEYEPYGKLPALFLGTLIDGRLDARDITAGILQLAQAGHISIAVDPKEGWLDSTDYCMRLNVNPLDIPHDYKFHLLTLLFGSRGVGSEVWISDLKSDTTQQQRNGATITLLKKEVRRDLEAQGYFEVTPPTLSVVSLYILLVGAPALAFTYWFFMQNPSDPFGALFGGLIVFVVGTGLFRFYVGYRRTARGYEARWHLLGFRRYLSVAEADRMTFHNAPSKNPQEFLDWLPYAVAFGVEKEWAAAFAGITMPTTSWYNAVDGAALPATQLALSTGLLAGNIGSLSRSAASASFGATGSGGSSGFGFSGGGGGGGGGRSW